MSHSLPPSDTHMGANIVGLGCGLVTLFTLDYYALLPDMFWRMLAMLAAAALPILLHDVFVRRVYRAPSTGLDTQHPRNLARIATKTLGAWAIFAFYGLLYRAVPEYDNALYQHFFRLMDLALPALIIATPFYFGWLDAKLTHPIDGYYHLGRLLMGRVRSVSYPIIGVLLRDWLVKAFFLPLMLAYCIDNVSSLSRTNVTSITSFNALYVALNTLTYLGDLIFATLGYVLTLRVLNSHIRSSDPTMLGWVVALACYAPFWTALFSSHYLNYGGGDNFMALFAHSPTLLMLWGSAILALSLIYAWATVCMGIRFSNLTYRGLITSGPYGWCKHPAYVAKNLSWWMISMPFISAQGPAQAAQNCLLLLGVNLLYAIRARTEERHLSAYPEYVTYAEAMNTQSLFAPLARVLPFLRYKKP